jgi:heme O synthase-like polyprenyltransferase
LIKRIHKISLLILVPVALLSALIEPKRLPLSVVVGGLLGLVNLGGLSRGLEFLLGTRKSALKLFFLGIFRLLIVFTIIILLAMSRAVDLPGLAAGFTVVFAVILAEGYRAARHEREGEEGTEE